MKREQLVRMEAQFMYFSQHVSRAVTAIKTAEFDLEEPEFFDWKDAMAWVTKLDACAERGCGKAAPTSETAAKAPIINDAKTVSDDDERTLSDELGF